MIGLTGLMTADMVSLSYLGFQRLALALEVVGRDHRHYHTSRLGVYLAHLSLGKKPKMKKSVLCF